MQFVSVGSEVKTAQMCTQTEQAQTNDCKERRPTHLEADRQVVSVTRGGSRCGLAEALVSRAGSAQLNIWCSVTNGPGGYQLPQTPLNADIECHKVLQSVKNRGVRRYTPDVPVIARGCVREIIPKGPPFAEA